MSIIDWPCGATTVIGGLPRGKREATEAEWQQHLIDCFTCQVHTSAVG